ncbi:MAG: PEGA domain-containing protein [Acidobacteriota bacterium]
MKAACWLLCVLLVLTQSGVAQQAQPNTDKSSAPQAAASTPSAPPQPNTLLDGTPIKLRLAENLSSETNKTNDEVPFEVTEEVDVMGVPVIIKGATALGTITNAEGKRRMGRGGKLDVALSSVRLVDGEKAQISASRDSKGGGHVGAMTGAMVATAVVFFPAAPLFLFMHGKAVEIPKGTEITAYIQGDMKLDMAKMVPAGSAPAVAAMSAAAAPSMASLTVEASVVGADIEVDGNFVGSTPSTVTVTPGQHVIVVKKKGYTDWTRSMNVSGSSVHLNADLDALPAAK